MTPAEIDQTIGTLALFSALAVFFVLYAIYAPTRVKKAKSVEDEVLGEQQITYDSGDSLGKYTRPVLDNFLPKMPEIPLSDERKKSLQQLLITSGNPWRLTVDEFLGLTIALGVTGFLAGGAITALGLIPDMIPAPVIIMFFGFAAAALPYSTYNSKKEARTKAIEKELPEALDLLTITMETGQTFDYALENITQQLPEGLLRNEFLRIIVELQAGNTLDTTLTTFSNRFKSTDLESFTKAVIKTQQLGSDLTETLSQQAEAVRRNYAARLDRMIAKLESVIFIIIGLTMLPAFIVIFVAPTLSQIADFFF